MNDGPLLPLFGYFALLSLFAVGGANAAIPEMHRIAVEVMHWMNDRQFADSFAIAQVSPGPNIIIVTLIGYHVAGFAGAAVATAAMCGPTCVMAFLVARTWDRFSEARWRIAIQAGLVPVSLGLIAASAFVLARTADHTIYAVIITATTALIGFATRINPLWIFAISGLLGISGWL
ncbi:MAG TPA: chromate transporter [Pseudolabrys sp.]|nr:chromate transporter [Pseudolabrys sp.]